MNQNHYFSIMCKPVCGRCNLDCAYCYYTMKPKELYPGVKQFRMTEEVLESYVRQYLELQPVGCEFGWQGGEPVLAGLDFYKKAVAFQKSYSNPIQRVSNSFQTNGTLLTDGWCEFLAENKFLVGISIDGPPQWHDKFRRDHHNNPTFHKAWKGVELCRKHGVEFNILVTLNSMNAPHAGDIYRYFVNRGIEYVQFIPILERLPDGTPTPFSCTPEQFGQFALDVFKLWQSRDVGKVSERLIDSVLHKMVKGVASTCCYADRCANAHIVEWNGDVYVCDHFVYREWKLGNLMETPLAEILQSPLLEQFATLKTELPGACRECDFLDYCRGGCPKHHMPTGNDPERNNYFCPGLKTFFKTAIPILQEMAPYIARGEIPPGGEALKEGEQRGMTKPAETGLQPHNEEVGRNDPCLCGSGRKYKHCCGRKNRGNTPVL